jgi:hypothetical protein
MPGREPFPDELTLGLGERDVPVEHVAAEAVGEAAEQEVELLAEPEPGMDGHSMSGFHFRLHIRSLCQNRA